MNDITKAEIRKKLGNIEQLQELLFGDRLEEYNRQLKEYELKLNYLENNYQKLESSLEETFKVLENKLNRKIDSFANSLNKKIKYINVSNQEEKHEIEQKLTNLAGDTQNHLNYIQDSFKAQNNNLKMEVDRSKDILEREIKLLKQQINDKLDASFNDLSTGKVSRSDLAEVLFELCLKLKEPSGSLELPESDLIQTNADLMLPEDKSTGDRKQVTID